MNYDIFSQKRPNGQIALWAATAKGRKYLGTSSTTIAPDCWKIWYLPAVESGLRWGRV